MKNAYLKLVATAVAIVATVVGCHGGTAATVLPAQLAHRSVVTDHVTTTAWGDVVDDPSGKPLAGILVQLMPWKPCVVSGKTLTCSKAVAVTDITY
jgi:hypothetical protein